MIPHAQKGATHKIWLSRLQRKEWKCWWGLWRFLPNIWRSRRRIFAIIERLVIISILDLSRNCCEWITNIANQKFPTSVFSDHLFSLFNDNWWGWGWTIMFDLCGKLLKLVGEPKGLAERFYDKNNMLSHNLLNLSCFFLEIWYIFLCAQSLEQLIVIIRKECFVRQIDVFVIGGGKANKKGHIKRETFVIIIKTDFGLTINIQYFINNWHWFRCKSRDWNWRVRAVMEHFVETHVVLFYFFSLRYHCMLLGSHDVWGFSSADQDFKTCYQAKTLHLFPNPIVVL